MLTEPLTRNNVDLGTVIMDGFGHGEFLLRHTADCCEKIRRTLDNP